MTLSVTIMASRERSKHVERMLAKLDPMTERAGLRRPCVVWAEGDPWHTARRAWQLGAADHRLVLQDDVDFGPSLLDRVGALVERRPAAVISLFTSKSVVASRRTPLDDSGFLVGLPFVWTQGVVLPRAVAEEAPTWCDERESMFPGWKYHDDLRLAAYCRHNGVESVAALPSLVEHLEATMPSLLGHPPTGRTAAQYDGG